MMMAMLQSQLRQPGQRAAGSGSHAQPRAIPKAPLTSLILEGGHTNQVLYIVWRAALQPVVT